MAHCNGEALRMEAKRKFDEESRNWDGGKVGVPAAPVPSCSNVRPSVTDTIQAVEDIIDCSFQKFKRSRMVSAGKGQIDPVRTNGDDNVKWVNDEPAEETLLLYREQDIPFHRGGGSSQPREIDVPNVKVLHSLYLLRGQGCQWKRGPETYKIDAASAGGAAVVEALDFGLNVRIDKGNLMSLNCTEEFLRVLKQVPTMNFSVKMKSSESGESWQVSFNGVKDLV